MEIDFVIAQLRRRRDEKQLEKVADGSGVSRRTIGYIMDGRGGHSETVRKLHKYLKATVRRKILAPKEGKTG